MAKTHRKTPTALDTRIENGILYFGDKQIALMDSELFAATLDDRWTKSIRLISLHDNWQSREYISGVGTMTFKINVEMSLRRETRSGRNYWYAYRRAGGKLQKRFVGQSEDVTTERLVKVAQRMI